MALFNDSWRSGGTGVGPYILQSRSAGEKPLIAKGVLGQTANILEVQNSTGTTLFSVDPSGNLTITGNITAVINETVTGDLALTGSLTVSGNSILGNAAGDTVTIVGTASFSNPISGGVSFSDLVTANNGLTVNGATNLNGVVNFNGTSVFTGASLFADGTAAIPSITFTSDTDTGLYRSGANALAVTAGGSQVAEFDSSEVNFLPGTTFGGVRFIKGETTTSNSTPIAILTLPLADNTVYAFRVIVFAFTDAARRACFVRQFSLYRDGGTAVALGTTQFTVTGSTGTSAVSLSSSFISTTNMVLTATGAAVETVNWSYMVEYTSMTV